MKKMICALLLIVAAPTCFAGEGSELAGKVLRKSCCGKCNECGKCCSNHAEDKEVLRCDVCGGKENKEDTKCACSGKPRPKGEQA